MERSTQIWVGVVVLAALAGAVYKVSKVDATKGGYIAEGYNAALDSLRSASSDGRRAIAALEARYREATGIASLKIRHNAVLGYMSRSARSMATG